jgi:hypothetical protein
MDAVFDVASFHRFTERSMSTPVSVGRNAWHESAPPPEKPVAIPANQARQGPPRREVLYVLGFGTSGAILAVAAVLAYFELFRQWS